MATDPICGMTVDPNSAAGKYEHSGQTYYFCSQHCASKFKESPAKYVKPATPSEIAAVERPGVQEKAVTDPVCGMTVDPVRAAGKQKHGGETYYFCSRRCMVKFTADPDKFLEQQQGGSAHVHGTAAAVNHAVQPPSIPESNEGAGVYVCPMDPEVRESKPGACPKCGMALEPATLAAPATRTEYVCPMHPEIVRPEPGSGRRTESRISRHDSALLDQRVPDITDCSARAYRIFTEQADSQ
jgi:Cu+-exporting ATPase